MLGPLDVIWIDDDTIEPPGPKMVSCIEANLGLFYRINSRANWQVSIPLIRNPLNMFLRHDSYLECGDPLEIDDYIISQSETIGTITHTLKAQIRNIALKSSSLSRSDKSKIAAFLR